MSARPADANNESRARVPLGQLLIEAGLLTEANLELALAEQKGTDRRLGQILVERGLVAVPVMANALAEQRGGLLKSEYGFATGLTRSTPGPGLPSLLPPTSPVSSGKKAWSDDDDPPPVRPSTTSRAVPANSAPAPIRPPAADEAPSMPTLRPVAPAEVASNGNVAPNPFAQDAASPQLVEPSAEAGAALLVALNDDVGIDEIEAAVAALRLALASEPGTASVVNASSGAQRGTSTREAETDAAPLALRIAELESELVSTRAARDEANASLAVARAALAQAEERATQAEARAAQAEVRATPAGQPAAEPVEKEVGVSEPPLAAQNEPHNGMVKFGANAASGGIFGPPRLGEMLVRHGRITQEQLSEALFESRQTGGRLGRVLLQKGWIFEEELARTLATQLQVPYVSVQRVGVDISAVRLLPREIGLRFSAIPVRFKGDSVQVAFADPSDEEALEAAARYVPSIELAVAELSDIESLWRSLEARARGEAPMASCRLPDSGPAAEA